MFLLQETKMEVISKSIATSFWKKDNIYFSFIPSDGSSWGILTLWNSKAITVISSFHGTCFLGTKFLWNIVTYYVVNIYSSYFLSLKRIMWKELLNVKLKFTDGEWIFGGDFNAVKKREERVGCSLASNLAKRRDLSEFIEGSGLVDVPCNGKKYSWYGGYGISKSRVDRFLVSNSIISSWGVVGQFIGKKDVSDHFPVWLVFYPKICLCAY